MTTSSSQKFSGPALNESALCLAFGGFTFDLLTRRVILHGQPISLSATEFDLLACLARRAGQPASHAELWREVWGCCPKTGGTLDQIRSCVKRTRQVIEPNPAHPRYLLTVGGYGYLLRPMID